MAGSLLDFGEMARTALGFANLEQTIRHNDIAEQNSIANMGRMEQQQEQLDLQRQKIKQDHTFRAFDELDKVGKNPLYATNPLARIDILQTQTRLLRDGMGLNIQVPSREEMIGSYEELGGFLTAARNGNPEEKRNALTRLITAAPDYGSKILDELKKAGELDQQGEEFAAKMEMNKANLQRLNLRSGQYKLQQNLYTEHLGALNEVTSLPMEGPFKEHFQKVMSFEKPEARQAYMNLHKDVFAEFDSKLVDRRNKSASTVMQLNADVASRTDALRKQQARTGEAPAELAEEVSGYEAVRHARLVESDWLNDPFNKEKWKELQTAKQDVRILYGETGKKIQGVNDERLQFQQRKLDDVKQEKIATDYAQEKFLERLQAGDDDNQAALSAIQQTKEQFPGVPMDTGKIKNMTKVGRQTLEIKMGQDDVSRQLKLVENSQSVIDYAKDLRDRIHANPMIVGPGAKAGAAFAGSMQQFRAILQMDPGAAKVLNTKVRDEAEAFHENLIYMQARTMDPSGPLDLKVVEHARQVVGDLSSFTTGPQQLLNKLDVVTSNAERNVRRARGRLRGGIKGYLQDGTDGSSDGTGKQVGDMTEQELLQRILGGTN